MIDPRTLGPRLDAASGLDRVAAPLHRAVSTVLQRGPAKDVLHGVWLGHPMHPAMTDLPIGFWTSAFVLDIVGGERAAPASEVLVGLGVASALPTAAAGLADWSELNRPERRSGMVHAVANTLATSLYALSFLARRRGDRRRGVALAMAGATAATLGGFLGGHLTFRRAAGVNHATEAPAAEDWATASIEGVVTTDEPAKVDLDGQVLAAVQVDGEPAALFGRCSHLGGPLHEGEVIDGCLRCPWHGSTFRVADGSVVRGPATAPQPAYELRRAGVDFVARRRRPS